MILVHTIVVIVSTMSVAVAVDVTGDAVAMMTPEGTMTVVIIETMTETVNAIETVTVVDMAVIMTEGTMIGGIKIWPVGKI